MDLKIKALDSLLKKAFKQNNFIASTNWQKTVKQTEIGIVCVGTPSKNNGSIELKHIKNVCEQLSKALKQKSGYFLVAIRSTIPPGTIERLVIPVLEAESGKKIGKDIGICMNPEFLREGSSVDDFYNPPKVVIGEYDKKSGDILKIECISIPPYR